MKKIVAIAILFISILEAKISVVTTIYPIYNLVQEIGGDRVELKNMVPFGVESHHYEPSAKDFIALNRANIFLTSSAVMEPWSEKVVYALDIKSKTVNLSEYVTLLSHDGEFDPHYWLSIDNYKKILKVIEGLLIKEDAENREFYQQKSKEYMNKLSMLKDEYISSLKSCKNRKIVVNHDAFGYLASDYNFTQLHIMGLSPDIQPSAKVIADLIKVIKDENISTIFFEEFANNKVVKMLSIETGSKVETLRPIENLTTQERDDKVNYLTLMKKNLIVLKKAMECR
jgi:zinc transport system substrate-binding protein